MDGMDGTCMISQGEWPLTVRVSSPARGLARRIIPACPSFQAPLLSHTTAPTAPLTISDLQPVHTVKHRPSYSNILALALVPDLRRVLREPPLAPSYV